MTLASGTVMAQRPYGIDVSSSQGGSMNWTNIKSSGISFAWAKATEGNTNYYEDSPDFQDDESGAVSAGVLIGAYHYARYDLNPGTNGAAAEAGWFWQVASAYITTNGHYLMPMLDVEDAEASQVTNLETNTPAILSQWVNAWCTTVSNLAAKNGIVVTPVIYSSSSFASDWYNSSVTQWIPWIADWNGDNPQTGSPTAGTAPWSTWVVWQYDDTNTMFSGPPASCDVDVFNGTLTQLTNTLVIGKATSAITNYWDPGHKGSLPGSGGSGTWDNTTTNWFLSGTGDESWGGVYAAFGGTPGTVTLDTNISAVGLTFTTNGYIITGTSDTLTLTGAGNIVVPTNTTNSIECILGGVAFNLSGGGTLYLNNAGNYSDGENVVGPNTTLQIPTDHPAGNDGVTLNLSNGGIYEDLDSTSGDQFLLPGSAVALLTGGGIFENPNGNLSMTNYITGSGSLTLIGTSYTLTLTDTGNNYTGGTIVQSGTLKASGVGTLGSTSGSLTANGGTLDLGGFSQTAGTVTIAGGTISDGTLTGSSYAGQSGTVSAILAGSAALTKTTTGTLTLSGANTYSGITTISGGLLQISSDGNLGTAPGSPVANKLTLSGGIASGLRCTASLTLNANRGITLTGPNGGSIQATTGNTLTYGGVITGSGALGCGSSSSLGYGVVLLSGANNYTGGTTIAAGTLRLGASGTLPSGTSLTIGADNNSIGGGALDLNGFNQTIGPLASSSGIGAPGTDTPTIKLTGTLTVLQTNTNTVFLGAIIGSGGNFILNGNSLLTLTGTNTYTGPTTLNGGTLALATNGSIADSSSVSIAAGAAFDVSGLSSGAYSFGSTSLTAGGSGTGASAAVIKGASSGTVSLASAPISLNYLPTSFNGDAVHPSLYVSQGTLSLNGNSFTVNNASGTVLGPGTYVLIQQASGSISSAGSFAVTVTGNGIISGGTAFISVSAGTVNLVVMAQPVFSNLATNLSIIYGASGITLSGTVSAPGPTYPSMGETILFTINSNYQSTTISDNTGDFSSTFNFTNFPAAGASYPITYFYPGDAQLTAASNTNTTLTVNPRPVVLTGTRPFDGTATAAAAILSVANIVGSDIVNLASGTATLSSSNVGPETITSVGTLVLGGPSAPNYTLAGASGSVTITSSNSVPPFSITGSGLDATGSNFVITWQSTPGAVYQVITSTNATSPLNTWSNAGPSVTASNTTTSATNPITSSQSFFGVIGQ